MISLIVSLDFVFLTRVHSQTLCVNLSMDLLYPYFELSTITICSVKSVILQWVIGPLSFQSLQNEAFLAKKSKQ